MRSQERGSHAEPAAQGALLWDEDAVVSGWVARGAALFICLPPARQELRLRSQAGRESPKKEKKMGQKSPLPHIRFEVPSSGKGKRSTAFYSSQLISGGFRGLLLLWEN